MLQELYCRNYKIFGDSTRFPLAPLTVLVGPNNAGKSSVIDLVRMISTERGDALYGLNLSSGSGRLRAFDNLLGNPESNSLEVGARTTSSLSIEPHEDLPTIHLADDVSIQSRFESLGEGHVLSERSAALHPKSNLGNKGEKVFSLHVEVGPPEEQEVKPRSTVEAPLFGSQEGKSPEEGEQDIWIGMRWGQKESPIQRRVSDHDSSKLKYNAPRKGPYSREVSYQWEIKESLVQLAFEVFQEMGGSGARLSAGPLTCGMTGSRRVNSKSEVPPLRIHGIEYFLQTGDYVPEWVPPHEEDFWRVARNLFVSPLAEKISKQLNPTTCTHLPSFRANPKRYYGSDEQLNSLLKNYEEAHPLTREEVEEWLSVFEIGKNLRVEKIGPDLYAASVERNEGRRYLADLGAGTAQLLPLILKLTAEKPSGIMLLEEPEANLHPNHQARLADLVVELMGDGHQILVETHSEYLVRRLQYLVASGDCEPQQTSVLYIDDLKGGVDRSPNIRNISIDGNGQLSEPLGGGFFDQATDLMVDLFEYGSEN